MMRILRAELAKVWRSKLFLGMLGALLCGNLLLLWLITNPLQNADSAHAYHAMNSALQGMSEEQKKAFLEEELHRAEALNTIESVLQGEAESGRKSTQQRKQYREEFAQYYALYASGEHLRYCDTILREYVFINSIKLEFDQVYGYDAYLDNIQNQSELLASMSIFAQTTDGFTLRCIETAAEAYRDMRGTTVNYMPQRGLYTALNFGMTDLFMVFGMLLLATVLVRTERDGGMLALIRSTAAGRGKTALAKLTALFLSMGCFVVMLYGVNFAFCSAVYGLGDFSRSIQSAPMLLGSTLKLNVGQYIALFLLIKWLAATVTGLWVMLCMLAAKRPFNGVAAAAVMPAVSWLMRSLIPAAGHWNVLAYANWITLLRTGEWLGQYFQLYWFAHPVSVGTVMAVTGGVCFAVFGGLFYRCFTASPLTAAAPRGLRLPSLRKRAYRLASQERYKLLIMNGALLFCAMFAGAQIYTAVTAHNYVGTAEIYYRYYLKPLQGPVTAEKLDWLREEQKQFEPLQALDAAYRSGEIDMAEYMNLAADYASLQQKYTAFRQAADRLNYIKEHPRAQFVYETGYTQLFDLADKHDTNDALAACLFTVLCFGGLFAMEKQSGMERILAAAPLGREATVNAKLRCCVQLCAVLTACSVLPRFWIVLRDYGLGALWAPAYSIPQLNGTPEIPLIAMAALFILARFTAICAVAHCTLLASQLTGRHLGAVLAAGALFGLPLLLSLSGLTGVQWISLYPMFHICALLGSGKRMMFALAATTVCILWCVAAQMYLRYAFGLPPQQKSKARR